MGKDKNVKKGSFKQHKTALRKCPAKRPEVYDVYDVANWITPQEEFKSKGMTYYQSCYIPFKDPVLKQLGIEVCARTVEEDGEIHNEMIFVKGNEEESVQCIHFAITKGIIEDVKKGKMPKNISSEDQEEIRKGIDIKNQYWMLKSFVEGFVNEGIQDLMIESLKDEIKTGETPIYYNHFMRQQVSKALIELAPQETKDLSLWLLEYIVGKDQSTTQYRMNQFAQDIIGETVKMFTEEELKRLDGIDGGLKVLMLDVNVSYNLANNPNLSPETLRKIIKHTTDTTKMNFAGHVNLPKDVIEDLITDTDCYVREAVATNLRYMKVYTKYYHQNEDFLKKIIKTLARDENDDVRNSITEEFAYSELLDKETIINLASDDNETIRGNIARRKNLPMEAVKKLVEDDVPDIKFQIIRNYKNKLPEDVIKDLARDESLNIRLEITRMNKLSDRTMYILSRDKNIEVKEVLSYRRDLPTSVVEALYDDENKKIRNIIREHLKWTFKHEGKGESYYHESTFEPGRPKLKIGSLESAQEFVKKAVEEHVKDWSVEDMWEKSYSVGETVAPKITNQVIDNETLMRFRSEDEAFNKYVLEVINENMYDPKDFTTNREFDIAVMNHALMNYMMHFASNYTETLAERKEFENPGENQ